MSEINQLVEDLNEDQKKIVKVLQAILEEKFKASNAGLEKTKAIEESLTTVIDTVSDLKCQVEKLTKNRTILIMR